MQNMFEIDDNDVIYKDVVIIGKYIRYLEKNLIIITYLILNSVCYGLKMRKFYFYF